MQHTLVGQQEPAWNKPCHLAFCHSSCSTLRPEGVSRNHLSKHHWVRLSFTSSVFWWTDNDSQIPWGRWDGNRVWGQGGHGSKRDRQVSPTSSLPCIIFRQVGLLPFPRPPAGPAWQGDMAFPNPNLFCLPLSAWHFSPHATNTFLSVNCVPTGLGNGERWVKYRPGLEGLKAFTYIEMAWQHDFIVSQSRYHGTWGLGDGRGKGDRFCVYLIFRNTAYFTVSLSNKETCLISMTHLGPEPIYHLTCLNILRCLSTRKHTSRPNPSKPDVLWN